MLKKEKIKNKKGKKVMKEKEFKKYGQEVLLTVLKIASKKLEKLKEIEDLSGAEIVKNKIIAPYEKLYGLFLELEEDAVSKDKLEELKKTIEKLRKQNSLDISVIEKNMKIRERLKEESGAKTVEKFFKYNLKKLTNKMDMIKEKYLLFYEKEEELENLLKDAIQEDEQFDILGRLQPIREELSKLEREYIENEKNIGIFKKKLESRWPYEIYGLISEEKLLGAYKELFKMED